jgi:hypothetical protein
MKYFLPILAALVMTACGDGAANLAVDPQNTAQNTTLWGLEDESASPPPPKLAITPSMIQAYKTCGKSFILCNPKIKQGLELYHAIQLNQLALDSEEQQAPLHGPAIINQLQLIGPIKVLN